MGRDVLIAWASMRYPATTAFTVMIPGQCLRFGGITAGQTMHGGIRLQHEAHSLHPPPSPSSESVVQPPAAQQHRIAAELQFPRLADGSPCGHTARRDSLVSALHSLLCCSGMPTGCHPCCTSSCTFNTLHQGEIITSWIVTTSDQYL